MANIKEIKELIKLMNENDLCEIEVEHEGAKIKLKRGAEGVVMEGPRGTFVAGASAAPQAAAPEPAAPPAQQAADMMS